MTLIQHHLETEDKSRYGFIQTEKLLIIEPIFVEVIQKMDTPEEPVIIRKRPREETPQPVEIVKIFTRDVKNGMIHQFIYEKVYNQKIL